MFGVILIRINEFSCIWEEENSDLKFVPSEGDCSVWFIPNCLFIGFTHSNDS